MNALSQVAEDLQRGVCNTTQAVERIGGALYKVLVRASDTHRPTGMTAEPACYFVRPFRATVLFRMGNQQAADGLAWVTLAPRLTQRNIPRASKLKAGLSPSQEPKV
ncbi:hypothetical protein VOLCADRAFT_95293 [Volvox carteri f. nagariensis]|uniref:Uncharacterized protein n=1 Tax=Volvox carteri f. nagariensis TaxID=3068 RepID=D8U740_VOLCA|nr:uncharacterized protein VOLCADRAFT_95293 [Volvox carteri f. nagariensis]EFJ44412.1 hypothetical protein VOLCADRAFT_95293 [Volvox carteri f. nagariensis]|eukprot:XP_002954519.1 hypothetical protein VOLCADRAFT_95293 [Volvox carteri f. nagariensis]